MMENADYRAVESYTFSRLQNEYVLSIPETLT